MAHPHRTFSGLPASLVNCYVDHALIGEDSQLIEADIRRCIIGRNVRIEGGSQIEDSVIFDNTHIGSAARYSASSSTDRTRYLPESN